MKKPVLNIKDLALLKTNPQEYYRKSYSHKPHLQRLPYDRNSKNPLKISARYLACKELEEEIYKNLSTLKDSELKKSLEVLRKEQMELDTLKREHDKHRKIYDNIEFENKLRLEDRMGEVKHIEEGVEDYGDLMPNDINGKILNIKKEVFGDGDAFVEDNQKEYLNNLASDLDDWIMDSGRFIDENGDLTPQGDELSALVQDIRDLGDNSNLQRLLQLRAAPPYVTENDLQREQLDIEMKVSNVKEAKREAQRTKDSVHKLTTELLDVVDEEMNCVDVFERETGGVYAVDTPVEDIERYIQNKDIRNKINSDGTIKDSVLARDRFDHYETTDMPYRE